MREQFIEHFKTLGYIPIENDVFNIAKRVREYDDDLVLFYNPRSERYEVHTCTFFPSSKPTYCVSCEFCDYEILDKLKKADNRVIDFDKKMQMVDEDKLKRELEKEKKEADLRGNFINEVKHADRKHFTFNTKE